MPFTATPITYPEGRRRPRARYVPQAERTTSHQARPSGEESAVRALASAARLRRAFHSAIVQAFRRQLEGAGDGPTDAQLQRFARIAVVEERLKRALGGAQGWQ